MKGLAMLLKALWPRWFDGVDFPDTPEALILQLLPEGTDIKGVIDAAKTIPQMLQQYAEDQASIKQMLVVLTVEFERRKHGNHGYNGKDHGGNSVRAITAGTGSGAPANGTDAH